MTRHLICNWCQKGGQNGTIHTKLCAHHPYFSIVTASSSRSIRIYTIHRFQSNWLPSIRRGRFAKLVTSEPIRIPHVEHNALMSSPLVIAGNWYWLLFDMRVQYAIHYRFVFTVTNLGSKGDCIKVHNSIVRPGVTAFSSHPITRPTQGHFICGWAAHNVLTSPTFRWQTQWLLVCAFVRATNSLNIIYCSKGLGAQTDWGSLFDTSEQSEVITRPYRVRLKSA